MRLNSGQPASERREGVKPRLALIGGVEAGATIADIQTTAATEQLLPLNPANRRTVVWEGRSRKSPPYPVCAPEFTLAACQWDAAADSGGPLRPRLVSRSADF